MTNNLAQRAFKIHIWRSKDISKLFLFWWERLFVRLWTEIDQPATKLWRTFFGFVEKEHGDIHADINSSTDGGGRREYESVTLLWFCSCILVGICAQSEPFCNISGYFSAVAAVHFPYQTLHITLIRILKATLTSSSYPIRFLLVILAFC